MNKSSHPNRIHRLAITAAGFVISVIGICAATPSAFAMLAPPPDLASDGVGTRRDGPPLAPLPVHHSAIPGWEIAVIVAAVVLIGLSLFAAVSHRMAARRRGITLGA